MEGPTAGAMAVIREASPIMNPSLSSGTCSSTMLNISGRAIPVPTPWISLPTKSREKTGVTAAITVPTMKRLMAVTNRALVVNRFFR